MGKINLISNSLVYTYNEINEVNLEHRNSYTRNCALLRAISRVSEKDIVDEFQKHLSEEEDIKSRLPFLFDRIVMNTIVFENDNMYVELSVKGLKDIIEKSEGRLTIENIASDMICGRDIKSET